MTDKRQKNKEVGRKICEILEIEKYSRAGVTGVDKDSSGSEHEQDSNVPEIEKVKEDEGEKILNRRKVREKLEYLVG